MTSTAPAQPLFSIVVPTHDRPALLHEAVASVAAQTCGDWELIVVDDGSTPPVDAAALRAVAGDRVTLLRHDQARGVAAARNTGYARARGTFIAQLDDDDKLAPDALEQVARHAADTSRPDVLFIGVEAFGAEAAKVNPRQAKVLAQTLARAKTPADGSPLLRLGDHLFDALLDGVPAAFQHPVFRREILQKMSPMRTDHWPEPAWAIEAAARALRCAFIPAPLYLWRRDGQSYFSLAGMEARGMDDHVAMKRELLASLGPQLDPPRRRALRQAFGQALFDRCYRTAGQDQPFPWRDFIESALVAPRLRHLRLLYRLLAPRQRKTDG